MDLTSTITLGNTGLTVSRVGFGIHPLGPSRKNLSVEDGADLMCYAYRQGIRFFDTAQFYQTYHYLKRGLEKMQACPDFCGMPVISSKSLAETYTDMMDAVQEALDATGLSAIDIFLLHQVTPGDLALRAGALEALLDAKRSGLIRAVGISSHHEDVILEAACNPSLDVVFALYNYSGLGIRSGSHAGSAGGMLSALKACRYAGKGVYTMKVFGGGNLTADYQKAARHVFLECADTIQSAVIGFTDQREVDDLKQLLNGTMPADYIPALDGKKLRVDHGDCLGCGTCVRICASGAMHYSKEDGLAEIDYSRCVGCNYCAIACPERAIVLW